MRKLGIALVLAALAAPVHAEKYEIDAAHSSVGFRIRHFVGKVTGGFGKLEGGFTYDAKDPKTWSVEAKIDASSIDTNNAKRDDHLRKPDFFDVERCPTIEFKSTKVTEVKAGRAKLHGDLTLHCVTKPVVLDLEIGGVTEDGRGGKKSGFSATGKIIRKDFGMTYNTALDKGGLVLGEDVDVLLDIEGNGVK